MTFSVRTVEYFYTIVEEEPNRAITFWRDWLPNRSTCLPLALYLLARITSNLQSSRDRSEELQRVAEKLGWTLIGPQHACLVQGDYHLGALAEIHRRLLDTGVSIYASTGVTDGEGHYGYVIYVKEEDHQAAARALAP